MMNEESTTDETDIGCGVSATFDTDGIQLLVFGVEAVSLSPKAFVELMRFARQHMGDEVFSEVDRMAGGGR